MTGAGMFLAPDEHDPARLNETIQQLMQGRSNAVGSVTLTASAFSTVVTAVTCGATSAVFLFPTTVNAAANVPYVYVPIVAAGTFTVYHPSDANIDKTFFWLCIG